MIYEPYIVVYVEMNPENIEQVKADTKGLIWELEVVIAQHCKYTK